MLLLKALTLRKLLRCRLWNVLEEDTCHLIASHLIASHLRVRVTYQANKPPSMP